MLKSSADLVTCAPNSLTLFGDDDTPGPGIMEMERKAHQNSVLSIVSLLLSGSKVGRHLCFIVNMGEGEGFQPKNSILLPISYLFIRSKSNQAQQRPNSHRQRPSMEPKPNIENPVAVYLALTSLSLREIKSY
jgi:hypothetical protein